MNYIIDINGPIVRVKLPGAKNGAQVEVGAMQLVGEIIALEGEDAIVQVYESTDALKPGDVVKAIGFPLSV